MTPVFGRGEYINIETKQIVLQLVKNPGGFRQVLIGIPFKNNPIMIVINDDSVDGRDVSWLWDVDFAALSGKKVITSGMRAVDVALRLQYDDIEVESYQQNLATSLKTALAQTAANGTLHIFANYTAVLKLRKLLSTLTEVADV